MSSSSSEKKPVQKRSRNGCMPCRKSKVKCDEGKPSCANCLKLNKKCDYSIKLTWGGRPYKVLKAEKLNPVAVLSRIQLNGDNIPSTSDSDVTNEKLLNDLKNLNSNYNVQTTKPTKQNIPTKKLTFATNQTIPTVKSKPEAKLVQRPTLNPTDNLNFLLKMSTNKNKSPIIQNTTLRKKQEPNTTTMTNITIPVTIMPSNPNDQNVSTNIQSANTMFRSLFDEKLISNSSFSLLEELDNSQFFLQKGHQQQFDQQSQTNNKIIGLDDEFKSFTDNNNNEVVESANAFKFKNIRLLQNSNQLLDASDEFQLDNFAIDLCKLQEDQPSNLMSIPLVSEKKWRTKVKNQEEEGEDEMYASQSFNSQSNALTFYSSPSATSSISEILEPVPRGLLPLPDMLLNVPYYYDSFLFYMNSTSSILTPADSSIYVNNPFKMVLPKLAMTNEGLMSLVVAFGTAHKALLLKQDSTEIVDSLLSRALSDLLILLNNKDTCTSDLTLTIVILFSSFLAFNYKSDKWKVHMNGAKQIFLMRGYNKPFDKLISDFKTGGSLINGEIKKSKLLYFLIRWFAYIDIFSNLSNPLQPSEEEIVKYCNNLNSGTDSLSPISDAYSSPNSVKSLFNSNESLDPATGVANNNGNDSNNNDSVDGETDQIDYEVIENHELLNDESHKGIDYMLGFHIKFLPIYSQLTKLIKHVNLTKLGNERLNSVPFKSSMIGLSPKIIESAINIQSKFQKMKFTEFLNDDGSVHAKSINSLIASNHCFLLMGIIQLYRRVLLMPRNSKIIQELCLELLQTFDKYINTKEPNALGIILPLFIAGCECQNEDKRFLFIEKLNDFEEKGSVSAGPAIEIITKCWGSDEDWCDIMIRDNKTIVFL